MEMEAEQEERCHRLWRRAVACEGALPQSAPGGGYWREVERVRILECANSSARLWQEWTREDAGAGERILAANCRRDRPQGEAGRGKGARSDGEGRAREDEGGGEGDKGCGG